MTRQQLATVLWRMAESPVAETELVEFLDAGAVMEYAEDAVRWMVENGLLRGSSGKLTPNGTASRVETAAILYRYLQLLNEE